MAGLTDILVQIGADITQLKTAVTEATETIEKISAPVSGLMSSFNELGEAIMVAFAVEQIVEFVVHIVEADAALARMSMTLGISIDEAHGFQVASEEMGGSADQMANAFMRLERAIAEAENPLSKQAAAFEALGIALTNADGSAKSAEAIFMEMADVVASHNGPEMMKAGIDAMGRSFLTNVAIMKQGSEGFKEAQQAALEASGSFEGLKEGFHETEKDGVLLWESVKGLSTALFELFKPAIDAVLVLLRDFIIAIREGIQEDGVFHDSILALAAVFDVLVTAINIVIRLVVVLYQTIETIFNSIIAVVGTAVRIIFDLITGNWSDIGAAWDKGCSYLSEIWSKWAHRIYTSAKNLWTSITSMFSNAAAGGVSKDTETEKNQPDIPKEKNYAQDTKAWEDALKAKTQASGNFYTEDKQMEVEYWKDKLASVTGNGGVETAERAFINDKLFAAEKSAHVKSLQDYTENMRLQIAEAGKNTATKMALVDQELAHLREIGAEGTSAYRQAEMEKVRIQQEAQRQGVAAARQATADYVSEMKQQITAAGENYTLKLQLVNEELAHLEATGQKETSFYRQAAQEKVKIEQDAQKQIAAIRKMDTDTDLQILKLQAANQKAEIDQEYNLHQISSSKKAELERQLTEKIYQEDHKRLDDLIATLQSGTKAYEEAVNKRKVLETQHSIDMEKINQDALTREAQDYKTFADEVTSELGGLASTMITTTSTWQQAFQSAMNSMVNFFIKQIEKMISQWIVSELTKTAASRTGSATREAIGATESASQNVGILTAIWRWLFGETTKTAATATGAATRTAITESEGGGIIGTIVKIVGQWLFGETAKTAATATGAAARMAITGPTDVASVLSYAAVGGAAAGASVAAIPFVGWAMAPEVAATTFTMLAAYSTMAAAEQGAWEIPGNMPVNLHKGEMVIPQTFAEGMRSGTGGTGGVGGDNFSINISAIDTQTGAAFLKSNARHIVSALKAQTRNGAKFQYS